MVARFTIFTPLKRVGELVSSATIKLFLCFGDPRRLRTAEISNWSGKAIAAPRTELDELLAREELGQSGVYVLSGVDPDTGKARAYVGEAEVIRDRLKQHKAKDFWVHAIFFVSKDENLTKGHIRYLEGRLIEEANAAGRVTLENSQASGAKLPESDREDMEVFLDKVRQLLPVLGSELVTPVPRSTDEPATPGGLLTCEIKGLKAKGLRTSDGFVVFVGSEAVLELRPSAPSQHPFVATLRASLETDGTLKHQGDRLVFTRDVEFTSPSAAAAVVHGGGVNGLTAWKDRSGKTLKAIEGSPSQGEEADRRD